MMSFLVYVVRINTNKDVGLKRMLDRYSCFADKDIKDKCVTQVTNLVKDRNVNKLNTPDFLYLTC